MAVEAQVYARNMEVTDRIQDYVSKKFSRLDRYMNGIEEVRVDLTYSKAARSAADRHVAQITVRGKGFIMRSEERADDIFAALDTALDKVKSQMERYKGKRQRGRGDGKSAAEVLPLPAEEEVLKEEAQLIARRKHFVLTPMNEAEAIEQMSLLGHESFFVFYNVHTHSVNVLYRRRDGLYGLIETEVG